MKRVEQFLLFPSEISVITSLYIIVYGQRGHVFVPPLVTLWDYIILLKTNVPF
jgi:hypothetical protein